jgi:hypothetical protein
MRENDLVLVVQRKRDRLGIVGKSGVADGKEIPIGVPDDLIPAMHEL